MGQDGLAPGQVAAEDGGTDGIEDAVFGAGDDIFGEILVAEIDREPGKGLGGTHGRAADRNECKRGDFWGYVTLGLTNFSVTSVPIIGPVGNALSPAVSLISKPSITSSLFLILYLHYPNTKNAIKRRQAKQQ